MSAIGPVNYSVISNFRSCSGLAVLVRPRPTAVRQTLEAAAIVIGTLALASVSFLLAADKNKDSASNQPKRALHALNRLTFGPRPGDIERINQLGVEKWIELQLHPEKIDDSTL